VVVLIEERGAPEKALESLEALSEELRNGRDGKRLRVRALVESARALLARRCSAEALARAEAAWKEARGAGETGETLDAAAKQEAARLQQESGTEEAAALLDRLCALSERPTIREYACILHCDLGFEKLKDGQFAAARGHFQMALDLDPRYTRAIHAIGTAYYNEAQAAGDAEVKLKLLQKALEFDPNASGLWEELGTAYYEKGLRVVRETTAASAKLDLARAIGLFRAAALTLNPKLTEPALDAIVRAADPGAEVIRRLPEGLYRAALENLASVARHRKLV
jgi:tetratricopeptide (TPR) repeat protein